MAPKRGVSKETKTKTKQKIGMFKYTDTFMFLLEVWGQKKKKVWGWINDGNTENQATLKVWQLITLRKQNIAYRRRKNL